MGWTPWLVITTTATMEQVTAALLSVDLEELVENVRDPAAKAPGCCESCRGSHYGVRHYCRCGGRRLPLEQPVTILLTGTDDEAGRFIAAAAQVAGGALCHRSRCGSVIVAGSGSPDAVVIGSGVNSPPDGCAVDHCFKPDLPAGFRSDRTCCVHAEQNAILDALRRHPTRVAGSRLYFIRLDTAGRPKPSGQPYCTICSKLAQAADIAEFVLLHADGITVYGADEYNRLSFRHAG